MGPHESPTRHPENQAPLRRRGSSRRPRTRRCLLKGCEQSFHPRRVRQRYCSEPCRVAARDWSRWKAQQKYRATAVGKRKRNGQSCRYRERVRNRERTPREEAVPKEARVITQDFFRRLLRPPRLLRRVRSPAALAPAAILFTPVPARYGTRLGAGEALEAIRTANTRRMTLR
jgi:hypothetical protein